jgi:hypothetical protein
MAVAPLEHPAPDPRAMLLERAVELTSLAAQVERERFIAVAAYADAHTTGALLPDLYGTYSIPDEGAYDRVEDAWVERFGMPGADRRERPRRTRCTRGLGVRRRRARRRPGTVHRVRSQARG